MRTRSSMGGEDEPPRPPPPPPRPAPPPRLRGGGGRTTRASVSDAAAALPAGEMQPLLGPPAPPARQQQQQQQRQAPPVNQPPQPLVERPVEEQQPQNVPPPPVEPPAEENLVQPPPEEPPQPPQGPPPANMEQPDHPEPPVLAPQEPPQQPAPLAEPQPAVPAAAPWILLVRPPPPFRSESNGHSTYYLPPVVQFQVTPNMTPPILGVCLKQALRCEHDVVGLFVEATQIFCSLADIVAQHPTGVIFAVALQAPRPPPPTPTPWWQEPATWWTIFAVAVPGLILSYLYSHWDNLWFLLVGALQWTYAMVIQLPLQELYRHGPWLIGWEGERLARICARITYHGDEAFWSRNLAECERIYAAKEEAWLRVTRPLVYMVIAGIVVAILRFIIQEIAAAYKHRPRRLQDREMIETYQAFQVLLRQVRKAVAPSPSNYGQDRDARRSSSDRRR